MIKAEMTKNIISKSNNPFGIRLKQIVVCLSAFLIGIILYFVFRNMINTEVLMTIVFIVIGVIISFGCINIQGLSLATYILKVFSGKDFRPYVSKGVFNDGTIPKEK